MKVLLINPWGIRNDQYYTSGFISSMNRLINLDYVSNYYYKGVNPNGKLFRIFFKNTENMSESVRRTILRGIEYIVAWNKIIKIINANEYDIIHIHWLLFYKVDIVFLEKLRKIMGTKKIILTAHNVIPHINGERKIEILKKVYSYFDYILVHGEAIRDEFVEIFPEFRNKIKVQYHGVYLGQGTSIRLSIYNDKKSEIDRLRMKYNKIFIMYGYHYFNKGTDRLIRIWKENYLDKDALLLVVGKKDSVYLELEEIVQQIKSTDNIIYIQGYLEEDILNYYINISDCVIVPYRHASMSGVVFTAATFKKMVICTKAGAISEYIEDQKDGLVCGIENEELNMAIGKAMEMSNVEMKMMGENLFKNIYSKFSWQVISNNVVKNIYC